MENKAINAFRSVFATRAVMAVLALTFTLTLVAPLGATIIGPGGSGGLTDDTTNTNFTLIDWVVDSGTATPANFTADTIAAVILDNDTDQLGFFWQVKNAANSKDPIMRLTAIGFSGFITDFVYRTDDFGMPGTFVAGGPTPTTATRSLSGDTLGFYMPIPTGIPQASTSVIMGAWTNAHYYDVAVSSLIDGGVMNFKSFAPGVPEPSTYVLLGSALLGLAIYGRRRRV